VQWRYSICANYKLKVSWIASWYELCDKSHSYTGLSEVVRRSVTSRNIGAIQIALRHRVPDMIAKAKQESLAANPPSSKDPSIESLITQNDLETGRPTLIENASPAFTPSENVMEFDDGEDDDSDQSVQDSLTIWERLGTMMVPKESTFVLKNIRRLMAAFGHGMELTNTEIMAGILVLEKYYLTFESSKTGKVVTELGKIEMARHLYKFAMAAYVSRLGPEVV
jgi:hypothetical protein